ncbi:hypothetical protein MTQ01_16370 [Streptomyces sp. XM4193]|uniref:hypothetical protein n=1 Tax=Streptomyces sp. XM4193 TaxID=2929782 RepID=UPI001FFB2456|nr:hypothetical protein [Streptomyces sp. XM4193]MCK1797573.1 hypothetical protein [Streptomyces sp. XM4193]
MSGTADGIRQLGAEPARSRVGMSGAHEEPDARECPAHEAVRLVGFGDVHPFSARELTGAARRGWEA